MQILPLFLFFIKQLYIHAFGCMTEAEIDTHLSHLRYAAAAVAE